MRKIINSAFVSLDDVTADPGSWAIFDPDAAEEAVQALHALGGMLMGRGTYEYFADVMPKQTGPYADAITTSTRQIRGAHLLVPALGLKPRCGSCGVAHDQFYRQERLGGLPLARASANFRSSAGMTCDFCRSKLSPGP